MIPLMSCRRCRSIFHFFSLFSFLHFCFPNQKNERNPEQTWAVLNEMKSDRIEWIGRLKNVINNHNAYHMHFGYFFISLVFDFFFILMFEMTMRSRVCGIEMRVTLISIYNSFWRNYRRFAFNLIKGFFLAFTRHFWVLSAFNIETFIWISS